MLEIPSLTASLGASSSAANPVAQFGNVYGGGSNKNWWLWLLASVAALALGWFIYGQIKRR